MKYLSYLFNVAKYFFISYLSTREFPVRDSGIQILIGLGCCSVVFIFQVLDLSCEELHELHARVK